MMLAGAPVDGEWPVDPSRVCLKGLRGFGVSLGAKVLERAYLSRKGIFKPSKGLI